MTVRWWHTILVFLLGFLLAYYMPSFGDMTIGRLMPRRG